VKPPVVYHLVPLRAYQVNGGIPPLVQARELSAGWRYRTQQQLLDQFGGLTFFPQPNEGFWTVAGITYRDAIVIYRVLTSDAQEARRFLSVLKERLKEELQQEDILIVERDVQTL
jgi:hypothetical protein